MTSLRPRVSFNKSGICNACQNAKVYRNINWLNQFKKLKRIANQIKKNTKNQKYNCIVPVGGGKDSSYVAWKVKHELGLKPLCVFCEPPLFTKIGKKNIENFKKSGFDLITLKFSNNFKKFDRLMFQKKGLPQHSWLTSITVFPIKMAVKYNCKYIFEGEEGESLYGGSNKNFLKQKVVVSNNIKNYIENNDVRKFYSGKILKNYKNLFLTKKEFLLGKKIFKLYWSNFEYWDESKHFDIAVKKCGLNCPKEKQSNSINKKSHIDQDLYPLHMYIAYLKFGFSRATTDTSIEIRHQRLKRKSAIQIVKQKDHIFPLEFLNKYLKYFNMKKKMFIKILTNKINRKIFKDSKNIFNLKLKKFE
jgi:N-acetyl sugar amidotransferase